MFRAFGFLLQYSTDNRGICSLAAVYDAGTLPEIHPWFSDGPNMISTNDRLLPNEHLDSVRVVYHKRSSSYYFFFLSSRWTISCFSGLMYNIKNLFIPSADISCSFGGVLRKKSTRIR